MFAFAHHTAPLSFAARSAVAAWHIDKNIERLRSRVPLADLSATDAQGRTLVDIYMQRGDRRAVQALRAIGAHRTRAH